MNAEIEKLIKLALTGLLSCAKISSNIRLSARLLDQKERCQDAFGDKSGKTIPRSDCGF